MKLTDFSIIFAIILCSLIFVQDVNQKVSEAGKASSEILNRNMDQIVESVLEDAFVDVDENLEPVIDLGIIEKKLKQKIMFIATGINSEQMYDGLDKYIENVIVVEKNGYYQYKNGQWTNKTIFGSYKHSLRMVELTNCLNEMIRNKELKIEIPLNKGEDDVQTINDYSLIVVYDNQLLRLEDSYRSYFMSIAAIKPITE